MLSRQTKLEKLNGIVWPEIWRQVEQRVAWAHEEGCKVCVVDAAVMLRAGWHKHLHEIWVTIAPEKDVSVFVCLVRGLHMKKTTISIKDMNFDPQRHLSTLVGVACMCTGMCIGWNFVLLSLCFPHLYDVVCLYVDPLPNTLYEWFAVVTTLYPTYSPLGCLLPMQVVVRVMERDGLTEEAARRRMSAQPTNQEFVRHANVVFSTQWEPEYTQKQVLAHVGNLGVFLLEIIV